MINTLIFLTLFICISRMSVKPSTIVQRWVKYIDKIILSLKVKVWNLWCVTPSSRKQSNKMIILIFKQSSSLEKCFMIF